MTAMVDILAQAYANQVVEASLHDADPGVTGAHEILSIPRCSITWSTGPSGGVIVSDQADFSVPAGTVVTHVCVWDSSGNWLDSYPSGTTFSEDTHFKPSLRYTRT